MSDTQAQARERQPARDQGMEPRPRSEMPHHLPAGRLVGKVAMISGGDSGIGRAVAVGLAKEGADVAILWRDGAEDVAETVRLIEREGRRALSIRGDVGLSSFCRAAVAETVDGLGQIDILVNNAAEQDLAGSIEEITDAQLERTFRTNVFSQFYLTRAALPLIPEGGAIINTASVAAYPDHAVPADYASTKGAVVAFTRSLAAAVMVRGIRVNAVAPGPILTPLIAANDPPEQTAYQGEQVPMGRPVQPDEVAPCYIFLASRDAATMTGQVLHPHGGPPSTAEENA